MNDHDRILQELRETFFEEALERVGELENGLLQLETSSKDPEVVASLFRAAHSIKGGAALVGFAALSSFTHALETLLDDVRSQRIETSRELMSVLFASVDHVSAILTSLHAGQELDEASSAPLIEQLSRLGATRERPAAMDPHPGLVLFDEEPVENSSAAQPLASAPHPIAAAPVPAAPAASSERQAPKAATTETETLRVGVDKIDALMNAVGEMVILHSLFADLERNSDPARFREALEQLAAGTRQLQELATRIRMLPIRTLFGRFPRMVRDLSHKLGKSVDLQLIGEGTELDKTMVEKLADPLVHLVRNAIDHGIETDEARRAAGKQDRGRLILAARHEASEIVIEISDNGRGLDYDRIQQKARSKGLIDDRSLTSAEIAELIFLPGFSTAEVVSDLSGRGVGLDVVRRNVQELGGSLNIESQPGMGTTFRLRLPLTLSIIDAQLVRVGTETYLLALPAIVEMLVMKETGLASLPGKGEVYRLRESYLPIVRLDAIFGACKNNKKGSVLIVADHGGERVGLLVDELLGQQQVVIKSLERNFRRVPGVSGATVLGDGTVALTLDLGGLVRLARAA